jgi:hypothetical protein
VSEGINYLSGGNHYVAGVLSPTPDQIDYLIGQVTGGVGRELSKVEQTGLALARGEELPTHKIPLAGRFFGDAHQQASEGNSFYANSEMLNRIETEVKGLQKDGKSAEAREVLKAHPESYLIAMANTAERELMKLRSEKRDLVDKGAPREKVKAVETTITNVMARLNRAVENDAAVAAAAGAYVIEATGQVQADRAGGAGDAKVARAGRPDHRLLAELGRLPVDLAVREVDHKGQLVRAAIHQAGQARGGGRAVAEQHVGALVVVWLDLRDGVRRAGRGQECGSQEVLHGRDDTREPSGSAAPIRCPRPCSRAPHPTAPGDRSWWPRAARRR